MYRKKIISLYLKVFAILFVVGILFPYVLNFLIVKFSLMKNEPPTGNCVFVMYQFQGSESFLDHLIRLISRIGIKL